MDGGDTKNRRAIPPIEKPIWGRRSEIAPNYQRSGSPTVWTLPPSTDMQSYKFGCSIHVGQQ